jgi:hypothetical protein
MADSAGVDRRSPPKGNSASFAWAPIGISAIHNQDVKDQLPRSSDRPKWQAARSDGEQLQIECHNCTQLLAAVQVAVRW